MDLKALKEKVESNWERGCQACSYDDVRELIAYAEGLEKGAVKYVPKPLGTGERVTVEVFDEVAKPEVPKPITIGGPSVTSESLAGMPKKKAKKYEAPKQTEKKPTRRRGKR